MSRLFSLASTTINASTIPLIILFLAGKFLAKGFVPTIYSDTTAPPVSIIFSNNLLFSFG
jgi:hypothetical protein